MVEIKSYYGESEVNKNNAKVVSIFGNKFYFSYETMVGFYDAHTGETKVVNNEWGTTTGKHLAAIDGGSKEAKSKRISIEELREFVENSKFAQLFKEDLSNMDMDR